MKNLEDMNPLELRVYLNGLVRDVLLPEWRKRAKPFYSADRLESYFGDEGYFKTILSMDGSEGFVASFGVIGARVEAVLDMLELAKKGDKKGYTSAYNAYGDIEARVFDIAPMLEDSNFVQPFKSLVERDLDDCIKMFPNEKDLEKEIAERKKNLKSKTFGDVIIGKKQQQPE